MAHPLASSIQDLVMRDLWRSVVDSHPDLPELCLGEFHCDPHNDVNRAKLSCRFMNTRIGANIEVTRKECFFMTDVSQLLGVKLERAIEELKVACRVAARLNGIRSEQDARAEAAKARAEWRNQGRWGALAVPFKQSLPISSPEEQLNNFWRTVKVSGV